MFFILISFFWHMVWKYFLLFSGLPLHVIYGFLFPLLHKSFLFAVALFAYFVLDAFAFRVKSKQLLPRPMSNSLTSMFSSKSCSDLMFKSLISFDLIFVCSVSCCSVSKLCPALCDLMDCSTLGFPVLLYLLEIAQIPIH